MLQQALKRWSELREDDDSLILIARPLFKNKGRAKYPS